MGTTLTGIENAKFSIDVLLTDRSGGERFLKSTRLTKQLSKMSTTGIMKLHYNLNKYRYNISGYVLLATIVQRTGSSRMKSRLVSSPSSSLAYLWNKKKLNPSYQ
jgi:hypothetical protein